MSDIEKILDQAERDGVLATEDSGELDPHKAKKVKISMWIDGDLLDEIKARAKAIGGTNAKYTALIHKVLEDYCAAKETADIKELVAMVKRHEKRINQLEERLKRA